MTVSFSKIKERGERAMPKLGLGEVRQWLGLVR